MTTEVRSGYENEDERPTRPITPVRERRSRTRDTGASPYQPTSAEIGAALDALVFYNVELGVFGEDAVRRMLVAAAIQRTLAAGRHEVRERVDAHIASAGTNEVR